MLDDVYKRIDENIKKNKDIKKIEEEIKKLEKYVKNLEKESVSFAKKIKEKEDNIYSEIDSNIVTSIKGFIKKTKFDIQTENDVLRILYKDYIVYEVFLLSRDRYIVKYDENQKVIWKEKFSYSFKGEKRTPTDVCSGSNDTLSGRKDMLEQIINFYKKCIKINKENIEIINIKNVLIYCENSKDEFDSVEKFISSVFSGYNM